MNPKHLLEYPHQEIVIHQQENSSHSTQGDENTHQQDPLFKIPLIVDHSAPPPDTHHQLDENDQKSVKESLLKKLDVTKFMVLLLKFPSNLMPLRASTGYGCDCNKILGFLNR